MASFGIYDQKQTRKSMPPDLKCNSRYFQNRFVISHNCETALFGTPEAFRCILELRGRTNRQYFGLEKEVIYLLFGCVYFWNKHTISNSEKYPPISALKWRQGCDHEGSKTTPKLKTSGRNRRNRAEILSSFRDLFFGPKVTPVLEVPKGLFDPFLDPGCELGIYQGMEFPLLACFGPFWALFDPFLEARNHTIFRPK